MLVQPHQFSAFLYKYIIRTIDHDLCDIIIIHDCIQNSETADRTVDLIDHFNLLIQGNQLAVQALLYQYADLFLQFFIWKLI